jgi:hypothetical protein
LKKESVSLILTDGTFLRIGQKIEEEKIKDKNIIINNDLFGISFGPFDGIVNKEFIIGWNNQNRIVYLEALSIEIKTFNKIILGDKKEIILEKLCVPYIENNKILRYQNNENETLGIIFILNDNNKVSKIIMFTYI